MRDLAATADAIAATSSKLAKVERLAAYLRGLDAERLGVATRFLAGSVLPTDDGRTLQVGWAALRSVLLDLGGADDAMLAALYRRHADMGDVARDVLVAAGRERAPGVDVLEAQHALSEIASGGGALARTARLRALLERCTPDEARLLVKLLSGDMRIGLREGLVEESVARAFDRPAAAVARANMILSDLGRVAVLARDDRLGEAAPQLFSPLRFMLASPVQDAAEVIARQGTEVWVEDKYDGIRCQLHRDDRRVRLFSRDLKDVTAGFPDVVAAARELDGELILDGELLAVRDGRVLPFQALQTRLGRRDPGPAVLAEVPVALCAWDILYQDGRPLLDVPLRRRRRLLEAQHARGLVLAHLETAHDAGELEALFRDARARFNEGLIAKDPDSTYAPGRRGLAWLKLKRPLDTLDVVVTGAEWGNGKRRDVLSDVTFSVRVDGSDELVPIGKAYTGLTDAEIAEMTGLLLDITVAEHGRFRTVEPRIVLEVAFDNVQRSNRHRSGYALRFPRIARWRHDKPVGEIDTLSRVAAIERALTERRELRIDES